MLGRCVVTEFLTIIRRLAISRHGCAKRVVRLTFAVGICIGKSVTVTECTR